MDHDQAARMLHLLPYPSHSSPNAGAHSPLHTEALRIDRDAYWSCSATCMERKVRNKRACLRRERGRAEHEARRVRERAWG